jgi:hypothetical protein
MYGTLTAFDWSCIFRFWFLAAGLLGVVLIDFGTGLARPFLSATFFAPPGCKFIGIEIDPNKHQKMVGVLNRVGLKNKYPTFWDQHQFSFFVQNVRNMLLTISGATHVLMCWEGWSTEDQIAVGKLVSAAVSVRYICVVMEACNIEVVLMKNLGFPALKLKHSMPVTVMGGDTVLHAYFLERIPQQSMGESSGQLGDSIVDAPPLATWSGQGKVVETESEQGRPSRNAGAPVRFQPS